MTRSQVGSHFAQDLSTAGQTQHVHAGLKVKAICVACLRLNVPWRHQQDGRVQQQREQDRAEQNGMKT